MVKKKPVLKIITSSKFATYSGKYRVIVGTSKRNSKARLFAKRSDATKYKNSVKRINKNKFKIDSVYLS